MSALAQAPEKLFDTKTAARLTGVTLRQIQWWSETNILHPRIWGHNRNFTLADVILMGVIAEMPNLSSHRRRAFVKVARQFKARFLVIERSLASNPVNHLGFRWSDNRDQIISDGVKSRWGVQLIDVQEIRESIEKKAGIK